MGHGGIRYPEFISLSVLNATSGSAAAARRWCGCCRSPSGSDTPSERWQDFTAPYTRGLSPFARVFIG